MKLFSLCMFSFLAGCAPYALAPLTTDHPAHPDAMAAPQRPVSMTLAYTSSDLPTPRVAATAVAAQQGDHQAHHETQSSTSQTIVGEGKVIATVPSANQIVVEHGPIKGFMDAMTMGYQVDPPSLLQGLSPGDRVRFTIDTRKKTIVKIEKVQS
jgi:Cu(I)/Ag(I) efflux system protein CusF